MRLKMVITCCLLISGFFLALSGIVQWLSPPPVPAVSWQAGPGGGSAGGVGSQTILFLSRRTWKEIHEISAFISLVLVVMHVGLNVNKLLQMMRQR